MKQAIETTEASNDAYNLRRKAGERGRYAAAYEAGHQTTVHVHVAPEIFRLFTSVEALVEANKVAMTSGINIIERSITIQYFSNDDSPRWCVSFNLQIRSSIHDGNLQIMISAGEVDEEVTVNSVSRI